MEAELARVQESSEGTQTVLAAELEAEKRRARKALEEAGARMDDCKERLAQVRILLCK